MAIKTLLEDEGKVNFAWCSYFEFSFSLLDWFGRKKNFIAVIVVLLLCLYICAYKLL